MATFWASAKNQSLPWAGLFSRTKNESELTLMVQIPPHLKRQAGGFQVQSHPGLQNKGKARPGSLVLKWNAKRAGRGLGVHKSRL